MEDERETHSKDKFLNLNSDPNVGLPTSRVFGTFCRHCGATGKGRDGGRERNGFHFRNKCFQFGWTQQRIHKIQFSNVLFRQHFDLVSLFLSRFEYFTHLASIFSLSVWLGWFVVTMKYLLFKFESGTASKSSDSRVQSATTLLQDTDADTATVARKDTQILVRATIFFSVLFVTWFSFSHKFNLSFYGILFRFVFSSHLSAAWPPGRDKHLTKRSDRQHDKRINKALAINSAKSRCISGAAMTARQRGSGAAGADVVRQTLDMAVRLN